VGRMIRVHAEPFKSAKTKIHPEECAVIKVKTLRKNPIRIKNNNNNNKTVIEPLKNL
jgi:hypothetical protein